MIFLERSNLFFILFFISLFLVEPAALKGFDLDILDSLDVVLVTGKMHLLLKPEELKGICRDNIIFSLDSPKIKVKNWDFDSEALISNVRYFKNDKKMYSQQFGVKLNLVFYDSDKNFLKTVLERSNLYISFFAVDQSEKLFSKCFVKSLKSMLQPVILSKNDLQEFSISTSLSFSEPKQLSQIDCFDMNEFNMSGSFSDTPRRTGPSCSCPSLSTSVLGTKFFVLGIFLLLFFSLYFFIPIKREEAGFRLIVGIFLFSLWLSFLIKICLIKGYWPFDSVIKEEQSVSKIQK